MDFTIDQISQQWYNLHNSTDLSVKKEADIFLRNFKKSPNCIDVCLQLFSTANQSNKIFACLILYQSIKENANILLTSKEKFNHIQGGKYDRKDVYEFKKDKLRVYVILIKPNVYVVYGGYKKEQQKDIARIFNAINTFDENEIIILQQ